MSVLSSRITPQRYLQSLSRWTPMEIAFWLATLLPFVLFPNYLSLASQIAVAALFALSLDRPAVHDHIGLLPDPDDRVLLLVVRDRAEHGARCHPQRHVRLEVHRLERVDEVDAGPDAERAAGGQVPDRVVEGVGIVGAAVTPRAKFGNVRVAVRGPGGRVEE